MKILEETQVMTIDEMMEKKIKGLVNQMVMTIMKEKWRRMEKVLKKEIICDLKLRNLLEQVI